MMNWGTSSNAMVSKHIPNTNVRKNIVVTLIQLRMRRLSDQFNPLFWYQIPTVCVRCAAIAFA